MKGFRWFPKSKKSVKIEQLEKDNLYLKGLITGLNQKVREKNKEIEKCKKIIYKLNKTK